MAKVTPIRKGGTKTPGGAHRRAQQRAVSPAALRRKQERGEASGEERALVRIGTSGTKVLSGMDDLSGWDDEELRRGRRRVQEGISKGKFRGRDPIVVPKALHDELVRRTLDQAAKLFYENVVMAVEVLMELVSDPDVEPKDRLRAIQMITDRAMGKAPEKVELSGEMKPWEIALRGGIVNTGGSATDDEDN